MGSIRVGEVSLTILISLGSRRSGFEKLRDIITSHRRIWTERFLGRYLRTRWEAEITEAGRVYHLLLHERGGKSPTLKQFAKSAAVATNHWFGGDVSALYGSIREKSPVQPKRFKRMPINRVDFAQAVYGALHLSEQRWIEMELANLSLRYVQLEEALGRVPDPTELGLKKLQDYCQILNQDLSTVWAIYTNAIQAARN
jgi:hypothetical protein